MDRVLLHPAPMAVSTVPRATLATSASGLRLQSCCRGLGLPLRQLRPLQSQRHAKRSRSTVTRAALDPSGIDAVISAGSIAAHNLLFSVADAAADVAPAAAEVVQDRGWFSGLADLLETFLKVLEEGLVSLKVPYAYGFSIILLTIIVKLVTYPLTKKQVESTLAMQSLTPQLKAIQAQYAGDQERIQMETAKVYQRAGVNPLAGCLPTLATLPIFIGLYQALSNVAKEGVLTEGFFWIPSLAGPTSIDPTVEASGISWLFPFVDGAPPLGWEATAAYLVLPVLLVVSQALSMQIMQPPQTDDPATQQSQAILKFLPLMIGWFSLTVPSGLSLYWFVNNILSTGQTVYLRKMGGATMPAAAAAAAAGVVGTDGIIDVGLVEPSAPPSTTASAASAVSAAVAAPAVMASPPAVTGLSQDEEQERARAERFRKRKEAEAAKRAGKAVGGDGGATAAVGLDDKERERAERFRKRKEEENARRAAKAAAEQGVKPAAPVQAEAQVPVVEAVVLPPNEKREEKEARTDEVVIVEVVEESSVKPRSPDGSSR
ncbi:unnamed protein product [Closterium sp. NIES-54]